MNIGIFTDTYLPDINGVVSSIELSRSKLEEYGHNVFVFCPYKGLKSKREGNVIYLPGIELKKLYGYTMASPLHYLLIDDIEKLNLDIIHVHTEFGVGIFANIVANKLNIPLVRTYHTSYEDYTHYLNFIKSDLIDVGLKKLVAYWSRLYCNSAIRTIVPSIKTKTMLESYGVNNIDVIPTGIDLDRFNKYDSKNVTDIRKKYIKDDERLLIYVGRIAKEKNIELIIRNFKTVKDNNLKLKLLIVGDGPVLEDLIKLSEELSLDDYVCFAGKKDFKEISNYYHSADGFICASTSETQGLTYIEALSSSLPVIAKYDDVLKDVIIDHQNGFFFDGDLDQILNKFASLSKEDLKELSENAKKSSLKYDVKYFVSALTDLYKEAIKDYKESYIITKTNTKDNIVTLTLKDYDDNTLKLSLSLDYYCELGFRNADKITKHNYLFLKSGEVIPLAYSDCLRKLVNRDYSVYEIKQFILNKYEINDYQLKIVLDKLKEKKLLDDYRYTSEKINSFINILYSKKKIIMKLKKAGISDEIINNCLKDVDLCEVNNCKKLADKYMNSVTNKSINAKKQYIYGKLYNEGYSSEIINKTMDLLDFSNNLLEEEDLIRKQADKLIYKYSKKYSGTVLRNKVFMALIAKGFEYNQVFALINEKEL